MSVGGTIPLSVRAHGKRLAIDVPAIGARNIRLEPEAGANLWSMERPLAPPTTVSFDEVDGTIFIRGPGFVGRRDTP